MRSNLPDFLFQCSHLTAPKVPPTVVAPCGDGWVLQRSACRERNDLQTLRSSHVSDTVLFSHEWHTYHY